ncbi:MAG TPA: carboxypeptidase-like regulatory domain-containing protein [Polyangiales bacterium]
MSKHAYLWLVLCCASAISVVRAQPSGDAPSTDAPRGPAEVLKRAQAVRAAAAKKPLDGAAKSAPASATPPSAAAAIQPPSAAAPSAAPQPALPPGHPPIGDQVQAPQAQPSGDDGQGELQAGDAAPQGQMPPGHPSVGGTAGPGGGKPLATTQPNSQLPVGSIRVRVLDAHEQPVVGAELQVGTMSRESGRTTLPGKTGADGSFTYKGLATGEALAYRVNLLYQGAKTSCMPFRLPADSGYDVTLRRLETTRDASKLVLYVGASSLELKDERIKIVQQVRLLNVGTSTYVFPDKGLLVPLPSDALAFQAEEVMTDQHLSEVKGEGFMLSGSVPPGEVTLTWGFDVPRSGTQADLLFQLPWPAFAYRVLADAAPGLSLEVDGMPTAEVQEDEGRRFLVTELARAQGQEPLRSVHMHLRGIPGPGPLRFIATALGALVIGLGLVIALRAPKRTREQVLAQLAEQKQALLSRAKQLEREHSGGEIGPEYYAQALAQLEDELAALLYEQAKSARS